MLAGRLIGILLFVLGTIATGAGCWMLESAGYVIKVMLAGPAMVLIGLAMIAFPGGDASIWEINNRTYAFWSEAPWGHRLMWIAAGGIGIAIALVYFLGD